MQSWWRWLGEPRSSRQRRGGRRRPGAAGITTPMDALRRRTRPPHAAPHLRRVRWKSRLKRGNSPLTTTDRSRGATHSTYTDAHKRLADPAPEVTTEVTSCVRPCSSRRPGGVTYCGAACADHRRRCALDASLSVCVCVCVYALGEIDPSQPLIRFLRGARSLRRLLCSAPSSAAPGDAAFPRDVPLPDFSCADVPFLFARDAD